MRFGWWLRRLEKLRDGAGICLSSHQGFLAASQGGRGSRGETGQVYTHSCLSSSHKTPRPVMGTDSFIMTLSNLSPNSKQFGGKVSTWVKIMDTRAVITDYTLLPNEWALGSVGPQHHHSMCRIVFLKDSQAMKTMKVASSQTCYCCWFI